MLVSAVASAQRTRAVVPAPRWILFDVGASALAGVAADADGSVWFAGNVSGRISQSGAVTPIPGPPLATTSSSVLLTSDKRMCAIGWNGKYSLRCLSITGVLTEFVPPDGGEISGLTETADGVLWTSQPSNHALLTVSRDGAIASFDLPPSLPAARLLTASDGTIWFTHYSSRALGHIVGGTVDEIRYDDLFAGRPSNLGFSGMAITKDGATWLSIPGDSRTQSYAHGGKIVRIDSEGTRSEFIIGFAHFPSTLCISTADVSVWFVDRVEIAAGMTIDTLVHLWPDGRRQSYDMPRPAWLTASRYSVTGLTVDANGTPWLTLQIFDKPPVVARLLP